MFFYALPLKSAYLIACFYANLTMFISTLYWIPFAYSMLRVTNKAYVLSVFLSYFCVFSI